MGGTYARNRAWRGGIGIIQQQSSRRAERFPWTTDRPATITRVQVQAKTVPSGCTTNAVVRLTDGWHYASQTRTHRLVAAADLEWERTKNPM